MSKSQASFWLDPDYRGYQPGSSTIPLKLITLTTTPPAYILVFIGICLACCIALIIGFISTERRHRQFLLNGVETTFTITTCKTVASRGRRDSSVFYTASTTLQHWIGADVYSVSASLRGTCDRYLPGIVLPGVYLPNNPYDTVVMSMSDLRQPFYNRQVDFPGGLLFFIGAAGLMIYQGNRYLTAWQKFNRLGRDGRLLDGTIIQAAGDMRQRNRQHVVSIYYEFRSPAGNTVKATQDNRREDLRPAEPASWWSRLFSGGKDKLKQEAVLLLPKPGTPVKVLYADESTFVLL